MYHKVNVTHYSWQFNGDFALVTLNEKQENQVKTEKSYEAWKIGIKELKRIKQMTKINMKELNKIVRIIKFFVMDKSVPALCNKFKDEIARELNQSVFVDNTFKKHMIYIEGSRVHSLLSRVFMFTQLDEEEKISLQPQMFRTAKATSKEESKPTPFCFLGTDFVSR